MNDTRSAGALLFALFELLSVALKNGSSVPEVKLTTRTWMKFKLTWCGLVIIAILALVLAATIAALVYTSVGEKTPGGKKHLVLQPSSSM